MGAPSNRFCINSIVPGCTRVRRRVIGGAAAAFARRAAIVVLMVAGHSVCAAAQVLPWLDEVRAGGAVSRDGGPVSDFVRLEALFHPAIPGPTYAPPWMLSPRPMLGATISAQGRTNEAYGGLTWSIPVPGRFLLEGSFGGVAHDQKLLELYPDRPEMSTRFMFRESLAAGYQITPEWRVLAFADHDSNGNLGKPNAGVNHFGGEVGRKFGDPAEEPPPAVPAPPFTWTGAYAGISGGVANYGSQRLTISTPASSASVTPPGTGSLIFGGQVGYNWGMGRFITGVEGDLAVQNIGTAEWFTVSTVSNWLATTRLRAGVNVTEIPYLDWVFIYGTGGAAFANAINQGILGGMFASETETRVGWAAGAGFELPLSPRWTAKFEYLYVDFGDINLAQGGIFYNTRFTEQVMRAGANFRF